MRMILRPLLLAHLPLVLFTASCGLTTAGCGARTELGLDEANAQGGAGGGTAGSTGTTVSSSTTSTAFTTVTLTTGTLPSLIGCSDGAREGFFDQGMFPDIAACSGGFQVPGVLSELASACGLNAGDDSTNPNGTGCSAADLCAGGWHVCATADEVQTRSPTGCAGAAPPGQALFFITRQSGTGCGVCAMGSEDKPECSFCACAPGCPPTDKTANDVFGCGSLGDSPSDCGVLDRFSNDACGSLGPPWACAADGCGEAHAVTKSGSERGGVMCCRD